MGRTILQYKWSIILALAAVLLAIKGVQTYSEYQAFLQTPLQIEGESIDFVVASGASVRKIAKQLTKLGLLDDPTFLVVRARMREVAQSIKLGEYTIKKGTLPDQLLDQMVKGKVKQYSLTVIEGWTFNEMMRAINQHPELRHTLIDKTPEQVMEAIGQKGVHPEGQFYPDTYLFPKSTTDVEFLKRAYSHMQKVLKREWDKRGDKIQLKTAYDALILASIIEKETAKKTEYGEIAGVFSRRLKRGMRLQTDPTVIYGLGSLFDGNLKRKHLRQDNPYNTYTRKGLPPTPIAMPSVMAIHAAIHPKSGKSLYFVSKGDGSHYFSKTLKEHNEAVIRYQLKGNRKRAFSSRPLPAK